MQWPPRPGPGIERHEAERLGLRRVDDLPHVDVHAVAHQRQLVDEPDVDGAERVLEQLHHFGDARRRHRHDVSRSPGAVERRRDLGAGSSMPPTTFGMFLVVVSPDCPGSTRSGENARIEIDAGLQSLRLEHRLHDFVGRPRIRRRLEDDELALPQRRRRSPRRPARRRTGRDPWSCAAASARRCR